VGWGGIRSWSMAGLEDEGLGTMKPTSQTFSGYSVRIGVGGTTISTSPVATS